MQPSASNAKVASTVPQRHSISSARPWCRTVTLWKLITSPSTCNARHALCHAVNKHTFRGRTGRHGKKRAITSTTSGKKRLLCHVISDPRARSPAERCGCKSKRHVRAVRAKEACRFKQKTKVTLRHAISVPRARPPAKSCGCKSKRHARAVRAWEACRFQQETKVASKRPPIIRRQCRPL